MTALPWHQSAWQHIHNMQQQQRLAHALLISGVTGLGKAQLAQELAQRILCQQPNFDTFEACQQCHSCQLFKAGHHPDYQQIDLEEGSQAIKIDQIRELKQSQTLTPKVSQSKIVLIKQADKMTISAFNSLLKLLEEPQENTVLMLLSSSPSRLPVTIRSRCQQIHIKTPNNSDAIAWLTQQNRSVKTEEWQALLQLTRGAPLAALSHQQESSFETIQQVEQSIYKLLNGQADLSDISTQWQKMDFKKILLQCQNVVQQRIQEKLLNSTVPSHIMACYWAVFDCITEQIKLESQNNLNKTLLIESFLIELSQQITLLKKSINNRPYNYEYTNVK